jgi:hypothetical protein
VRRVCPPALRAGLPKSFALHSTHGHACASKTFLFERYLPPAPPTTKPKSSVARPAPRPMGYLIIDNSIFTPFSHSPSVHLENKRYGRKEAGYSSKEGSCPLNSEGMIPAGS